MTAGSLLSLLVLVWAISWPVIRAGVAVVPPIWFAFLRYVIATLVLVAVAVARGQLRPPPRSDRRLVLVSGALQMAVYSLLTSVALTRVPAGRASVLAFSTPLWVVPLAIWRGQERVARRALGGVALGLAGILIIAAPSVLRAGDGRAAAYGMLLAAAAAWAISIVYVRAHKFVANPFALAPWQTLVASLLLGPVALVVEGLPPPIAPRGIIALAYVGTVATAFAYWAVVEVGRRLPASTLSVALLGTPSLGLVISALTQGESIGAPLVAGTVLVGAGIRMATASRPR